MVALITKEIALRVTWDELKSHITLATPLQYENRNITRHTYYQPFVKVNNTVYFTNLYSEDHWKHEPLGFTDFVDNYKTDLDMFPPNDSGVADGSRLKVHQTSRITGTVTYFTCASDMQTNESLVGGNVAESQKLKNHHEVGDDLSEVKYLDLNCAANETYVHEGYIQWKDALNDEVTVSFVPKLSTVSAGVNTFYNLYNGYLVVPAAGDGVTQVDDMVLVEMPKNEFGRRAQAFWNADYNTTTHAFENVTAALLGDGVYNMFTVEVLLETFANKIPLLGDGFMNLQTSDSSQMGHNIRVKVVADTIGADHEWWWNMFATFHRKRTT